MFNLVKNFLLISVLIQIALIYVLIGPSRIGVSTNLIAKSWGALSSSNITSVLKPGGGIRKEAGTKSVT